VSSEKRNTYAPTEEFWLLAGCALLVLAMLMPLAFIAPKHRDSQKTSPAPEQNAVAPETEKKTP